MATLRRVLWGMAIGALLLGVPIAVTIPFTSDIHNDWGSPRGWTVLLAVAGAVVGALMGGLVAGFRLRGWRAALLGGLMGLPMYGFLAIPGALLALAIAWIMGRLNLDPPGP